MTFPWEMLDIVMPDVWVALAGMNLDTVLFGLSFTHLPEFVIIFDLWTSHFNAMVFVKDVGVFFHVAPFLCNVRGRSSWAPRISCTVGPMAGSSSVTLAVFPTSVCTPGVVGFVYRAIATGFSITPTNWINSILIKQAFSCSVTLVVMHTSVLTNIVISFVNTAIKSCRNCN